MVVLASNKNKFKKRTIIKLKTMNFLKSIAVLVLVTCSINANAQWGKSKKVKGNGDITTVNRSTNDYNGVKVSGSLDVHLVEGNEGDISIKGDSNLMEYIITEVKNNNLVVKVKKGFYLKPSKSLIVTVPYESINNIGIAGSGDIKNSGTIKADELDISVAGSGDIDLNVNTNSLESSIAGSGDIEITGKTENLVAKIAGYGSFNGSDLDSIDVTVKISVSGDADVVCNGNLIVRISGSGDVNYSGTPKNKDTKISGSGSVSN
ncbi:MAG: head GIN domain-containing protein [Winogradskyella sp.]